MSSRYFPHLAPLFNWVRSWREKLHYFNDHAAQSENNLVFQ